MEKKLICISCPIGCHLTAVRENDSEPWEISGNRCPRGELYAKSELTDPRRVVTATVRSNSTIMPRLPVRTSGPLPKRHIDALLNQLYAMEVEIPVKRGEILLANVENTGIDVIFSSDCNN
ncbi:DUF1667 domain-containing protein [uncultured Victivallis sp.]|uniref:DUF1667 domain-containing protein n=1 Tax=uncultured Victivallis sp. TaxID=354118 RepID=UPI0025D2B8B8|nr:DUF1667 domain-containing protein [uncultured Victivallis sp.]